MPKKHKNFYIALLLSLIPGGGQLYVGNIRRAVLLLVIDLGMVLTFIFSHSYMMKTLMVLIYFPTMVPSSIEAYQIARYGKNTIDTSAQWYIILLLLTTGFTAIPLLWESPNFSKKAKILWSIAVPLLAILFFGGMKIFGDQLEGLLRSIFGH